jgi:Rrf2 family transcriptional regulator, nitric oxide-sensitive transcriptional repressor
MRLTTYTDYTFRALMYLAVSGERYATIAEIAAAYRISEAHLMKVVHQLGVADIVETQRGRHGGIRLGRPPEAIRLGAILRLTEADLALVPCFDDTGTCTISKNCMLSQVLREALAAFLAVLDRYTLADLVVPRQPLASLLGLPDLHSDSVRRTG